MTIFVLPKRHAEVWDIQESHAWISINDPQSNTELPINHFTEDVLTLNFDDLESGKAWEMEIKNWSTLFKREPILFDEKMAKQVFDFFQKNKTTDNLLIHCHAGISRSAGVGSFLSQVIGENKFMNPPFFPNSHVRNLLRRTWLEETGVLIL